MEENNVSKRWKRPRKLNGLGDAVEIIAQPIAGLIDGVFKTNIKGCSSCKERRDKLNELMPFNDPSDE